MRALGGKWTWHSSLCITVGSYLLSTWKELMPVRGTGLEPCLPVLIARILLCHVLTYCQQGVNRIYQGVDRIGVLGFSP